MSTHWSDYWKQGYTTSFGSTLDNYEGVLEQFWKKFAVNFVNDFKVLDLCSGNGSIPLLLSAGAAQDLKGTIIGVDSASVKLSENTSNTNVKIELLSNVSCETTGLQSEAFDYCVSQFGIEYSDLEKTIPEIVRVLNPEGEVCFIMHHSRSCIIKSNEEIFHLLKSSSVDDLFSRLEQLLMLMGDVNSPESMERLRDDVKCEEMRSLVNQSIKELMDINEKEMLSGEILRYVKVFFSEGKFWPLNKKIEYLNFAKNEVFTARVRLQELLNSAKNEEDLSQLLKLSHFNELQLLSIYEVKEKGDIVAWAIKMRKRSLKS